MPLGELPGRLFATEYSRRVDFGNPNGGPAVSDWSVQRRFPRYVIQLPVLHKTRDPAADKAGGWTRDLSEGGACVELAEGLCLRMPLRLLFRTDRGGFELQAQVVWVGGPSRLGGGILHGVTFTSLPPDQLQALRDLIRSKGQVRNAGVRVPVQISVTCTPAGSMRPAFQGLTADISRGGLLLLLPEVFPPGSTMHVTLQTPNGPITLEGAIVWMEPPGGQAVGPPFRHGFRFTRLRWSTSLSLGLFLVEAV
jgi:hypothetical protein